MQELESRWLCMTSSSASPWFIMYCAVLSQPLWCRCPSCCFPATGYSTGFGQWYRRYCGICISFPQSPVGQPGAVYLSGYKAARQRAEGKGTRTEVGVKGTGCHCAFQQGCEICKCLRHGWRRLWKLHGSLWFIHACICIFHPRHTMCAQNMRTHIPKWNQITLPFSTLHQPLLMNLFPLTPPSFWTDLFSLRHFIYLAEQVLSVDLSFSHLFCFSWPRTHLHS